MNDYIKGKYLSFRIDKELYAIEVAYSRHIMSISDLNKTSDEKEYLIGHIDLYDEKIPVLDIRIKFNNDNNKFTDKTCVVILNYEGINVGIVVDDVEDVIYLEKNNITVIPSLNTGQRGFISGIGKINNLIYILLSCQEIIGMAMQELDYM